MPVYFFNIREGEALIVDPEGSDLPDEAAMRAYAVDAARDLLSAAVLAGRLPLDHAIEVTDEAGRPVLTVAYADAVERW
jgi:hypothetical protein